MNNPSGVNNQGGSNSTASNNTTQSNTTNVTSNTTGVTEERLIGDQLLNKRNHGNINYDPENRLHK